MVSYQIGSPKDLEKWTWKAPLGHRKHIQGGLLTIGTSGVYVITRNPHIRSQGSMHFALGMVTLDIRTQQEASGWTIKHGGVVARLILHYFSTMSMSVLLSKSEQTLFRTGLQGCMMQWVTTRGSIHEGPFRGTTITQPLGRAASDIPSRAWPIALSEPADATVCTGPARGRAGRRGRRHCVRKVCPWSAFSRADRPLVSRDAVCGEGYHILEKSALGSAGATSI